MNDNTNTLYMIVRYNVLNRKCGIQSIRDYCFLNDVEYSEREHWGLLNSTFHITFRGSNAALREIHDAFVGTTSSIWSNWPGATRHEGTGDT
jgi:hypothetical protein